MSIQIHPVYLVLLFFVCGAHKYTCVYIYMYTISTHMYVIVCIYIYMYIYIYICICTCIYVFDCICISDRCTGWRLDRACHQEWCPSQSTSERRSFAAILALEPQSSQGCLRIELLTAHWLTLWESNLAMENHGKSSTIFNVYPTLSNDVAESSWLSIFSRENSEILIAMADILCPGTVKVCRVGSAGASATPWMR